MSFSCSSLSISHNASIIARNHVIDDWHCGLLKNRVLVVSILEYMAEFELSDLEIFLY